MNIEDKNQSNKTSAAALDVVAESPTPDSLGTWIEMELLALEIQFADFVTKKSTRAYFNQQR